MKTRGWVGDSGGINQIKPCKVLGSSGSEGKQAESVIVPVKLSQSQPSCHCHL